VGGLGSYSDAPTPSQMTYLQQAETCLQEALDQVNQVLSEYSEFKNQAMALNPALMKNVEPLSINRRPEA